MIDKYGYIAPIDTYKPATFNFIKQIDFTGLLKISYPQKHADTSRYLYIALGQR